jgi:hypothetical protein
MENSLLKALQTKNSLTENGCVTNSSSLNNCVDLFFQIGAMRGQDKQRLLNAFTKSFGEDPLTAMKLLFWARDIRGGAGERQIFRDIIEYLANNRGEVLSKNLHLITEFGRWDDLFILIGTPLEKSVLDLISKGLIDRNGLCAKWCPRPNTGNDEKKKWAGVIRKYLGLSPKEYRKLLVENSNTVEQLMCAKEWSKIDYSKLPSKAMSDLMKAFSRNDLERFQSYLNDVKKGDAKINAGAVYPYDIIKNLKEGNFDGANTQWEALPNYLEGGKEMFLPVVDVSGSMSISAGNNPKIRCIDVAISLGIYISERNEGLFKDSFITFSENPVVEVLKGSLHERYNQLSRANWNMSTNIEAVFKLILSKAKAHNVSEKEMPTMILILSDMEFNEGIESNWDSTAQEMIESMYFGAGYTLPKIVYWNIQSRNDNNKPVSFDKNGVCLVSGFSPSLLTNLLAGKDMTPYNMMMSVINSERYSPVSV